MFLKGLSQRPCYRWVILAAGCLSMFLNFGYLCGGLSIMAICYQDHYKERMISSSIASAQLGICIISSLPNYYAARRFGDRIYCIFGAVLTCCGYVLTGFTREAWQGVLTAGLLTGLGAGICTTTSYRMIPVYFAGKQFIPFALISGFNLLASVVIPRTITTLSAVLEFQDMFLLIGITFFILNTLIALFFEPRQEVESKTSQEIQSTENIFKIDLRIPRQDSAMFNLPNLPDTINNNITNEKLSDEIVERKDEHEIKEKREEVVKRAKPRPLTKRQSSAQFLLSEAYPQAGQECPSAGEDSDQVEETAMKVRAIIGNNIISMFSDAKLNSLQMKNFIRQPKVILHHLQIFCYASGFVMFNGTCGDYARHVLNFNDDQIADALTALAGAGIAGTVMYVILAKYVKFSPVVMHTVLMLMASGLFLGVTYVKSYEQYLAVSILFGIVKSLKFANFVNITIEIAPNTILAVNLYSIQSVVHGLGCLVAPYMAGPLISKISEYAGMYAASCLTLLSALVFLPVAVKYMWRPKQLQSPIPRLSIDEDIIPVVNKFVLESS